MFKGRIGAQCSLVMAAVLSLALAACLPEAPPTILSGEQMRTAIAGTAQAMVTQIQPPATQLPSPTHVLFHPTETPMPTVPPSPTQTAPGVAWPECIPNPAQYELGLVTNVVDGDTIDALIDGQERRIRYIGMDTPESTTEVEPLGEEAAAQNRALVEGQVVALYKDVSETDRFGRLLRFVFVEDLFVNYELVRQGFASVSTFPPDVACEAYYLEAQQAAVAAGAGLWGAPVGTPAIPVTPASTLIPTATLTPAPLAVATQAPVASSCDPAYPSVCLDPDSSDYDCAGGSGNGPDYVRGPVTVLPPDPFGLDRDGDGVGCES